MSFPVKFYHEGMQGIPKISGQAGAFIALMDAVMISGFNSKTFDSVVITGNSALATISAGGHGFLVDDIVLVSGATTPAALNAEWKVTAQTTTTVTFATTGIADQTATGTIIIKFAPIGGWAKVFSGANLAVYQSTDTQSNKPFFRVDDTAAQYTSVRMYETMSDVNTGTNPTPSSAQQATYGVPKSATADATTRKCSIIGCSRTVYGGIGNPVAQPDIYHPFGFGEIKTFKAGDVFNGFISFGNTNSPTQSGDFGQLSVTVAIGTNQTMTYTQRNMANTGSSTTFAKYSIVAGPSGLRTANQVYPALCDNGVHICKIYATDGLSQANGIDNKRGEMPGIYFVEEYQAGTHLQKTILSGQTFINMAIASQQGINFTGRFFFQLDDWYA